MAGQPRDSGTATEENQVRSNYTEAEQIALKTMAEILGPEVGRATKILIADLDHLLTCESPEHRAVIVKQAKEAASNLLNSLRYAAWIEAELSEIRVFADPNGNLKQVEEALNEVVEKFKQKAEQEADPSTVGVQTPVVDIEVPAPPQIEIVPSEQLALRVLEIEMDKLANAPTTPTKQ